jgi:hypothetical protein
MTTKFSTGYTPFLDEPVIPPPDGATGPVLPSPPVVVDRYDPNTGRVWSSGGSGGSGVWEKQEPKEQKLDPHWCKVSLLLNFDYKEGDKRIYDVSQYNHRVYGSAADSGTTRDQSKFGGGSLRFFDSGTNLLVIFPNQSLNIAYDDFTIETWILLPEDQEEQVRYIHRTINQNSITITTFGISATGRLFYDHASNSTVYADTVLQPGQWYHIAVSRTRDVVRFFVDGILDGTTTGVDDPNYFVDESVEAWLGGSLNAFIDDFRVTKGIGRYVRDFELPESGFEVQLSSDTKRDSYWDQVVALFNMDYLSTETTITDKSRNNIEATLANNATLNEYDKKFGNAALFRYDDNDYLSCTDTSFSIGESEDFTIEAWVKIRLLRDGSTDTVNGTGNIFKLLDLSLDLLDEAFILTSGETATTLGACTVADGTIGKWMHVALTRKESEVRLWVNGYRSGDIVDDGGTGYAGDSLMVGKEEPGVGGLRPIIDDFRFTKGVARYQAPFTPPVEAFPTEGETEPDPYYSNVVLSILSNYHQTGATEFIDSSLNAAVITTFGNPVVTDSEGLFGASFDLPSGSALTALSDGADGSSTEDFTLEAWVNLATLTGTRTAIAFLGARLCVEGGLLSFQLNEGGWADAAIALAGSEISVGEWAHIALSREDGSIKMFKDGELLATLPGTPTDQTYIDYETIYIGAGEEGEGFTKFLDGFIDQIRVTRGVARYTESFAPPFRSFGNSGCFKIYTGLLLPGYSVFPVPTQVYI